MLIRKKIGAPLVVSERGALAGGLEPPRGASGNLSSTSAFTSFRPGWPTRFEPSPTWHNPHAPHGVALQPAAAGAIIPPSRLKMLT
jgi:hypothetical protein